MAAAVAEAVVALRPTDRTDPTGPTDRTPRAAAEEAVVAAEEEADVDAVASDQKGRDQRSKRMDKPIRDHRFQPFTPPDQCAITLIILQKFVPDKNNNNKITC